MNETYTLLLKKKNAEISELNKRLLSELSKNQTELNPFFEKFLFNSPKRLRPLFIFLMCDYLKIEIDDNIIKLALAIELLHSASLIHDDILDDGTLRRNLKCIHIEKGYKMAVLAGDYLLSLAMDMISKLNNKSVLEIMANATKTMTKSEINALNSRYKIPDVSSYIMRSKEKTASLFVASIKAIGEIKNIKIEDNLINFTENFALCFQIKDDINNFKNEDKDKTSSDKKEGIYTLPLILNSCGIIDEAIEFLNDLIKKTKTFINNEQPNDLIILTDLLIKD